MIKDRPMRGSVRRKQFSLDHQSCVITAAAKMISGVMIEISVTHESADRCCV